jgi:Electron transfer DM13
MKLARALVLAAAAAAATTTGVYVAGGVITNDFRASMALTAIWFAVAAAIAVASLKARRSIGLPILAGYLIAAVSIGAYLASTTLIDKTVNEVVVVADPVPAAQVDEPTRQPRNVLETRGTFTSAEHTTRGIARVIKLPAGRRVLTLTGFETDAGPDLRVRIGEIDLGALKGNKGDQQYDIPDGFKPRNHTVQIWCRAFSALFGSAQLRPV